jgi:hypothetical protein
MPYERMRSLRSGWELLQAFQTDSSIPPLLVARAPALAQSYPTPQTLILMLQADRPRLPEGFGDSVDGARALFEEVQFGGHPRVAHRPFKGDVGRFGLVRVSHKADQQQMTRAYARAMLSDEIACSRAGE